MIYILVIITNMKQKGKMIYTEKDRAKAIKLRNKGTSIVKIAKIIGTNVKTISKWTSSTFEKIMAKNKQMAIKLRNNGVSISSIARELHTTRSKISVWTRDCKLQPNCTSKFRECVREMKKSGKSNFEIREKIPISSSTIYRWCADIETEIIHPRYKTKEIQHDYFSSENLQIHPERFVIMGFIAADGCIHRRKDNMSLVLNLSRKDVVVLENINKELAKNTRLIYPNKKNKSAIVSFPSNEICQDLARYNIIPRKTATFSLPILSLNEMSYFLRGYYYGDGCLIKGKTPGTRGYLLVGNIHFTLSLEKYLIENRILDRCKYYKIKNSKYKQIHIKGTQGVKFSKFIFENDKFSILPRKQNPLH